MYRSFIRIPKWGLFSHITIIMQQLKLWQSLGGHNPPQRGRWSQGPLLAAITRAAGSHAAYIFAKASYIVSLTFSD